MNPKAIREEPGRPLPQPASLFQPHPPHHHMHSHLRDPFTGIYHHSQPQNQQQHQDFAQQDQLRTLEHHDPKTHSKVLPFRQLTESFLRRAFADEHASRWLTSRDHEPPTSITPEMMRYSITTDMYVSEDSTRKGHIYRRADGSDRSSRGKDYGQGSQRDKEQESIEKRTSSSPSQVPTSPNSSLNPMALMAMNHGQPYEQQQDMPFIFSLPEKMVFVRHGSAGNKVFFSLTDSRTPFAFLEPPSESVPGVRRGFIETTQTDMFMTWYHWLESGNSCLMTMNFSYDPKVYTKRCIMQIGPFPSESRNPNINDVIESACVQELRDCPFCIMRGQGPCECPSSLLLRMRPRIPADHRDPWSAWAFFLSKYDSGLKKERYDLANFQKGVHVSTEFLFQMDPTLGSSTQRHRDGYQHYLNEVFPLFNGRMLTWSIPVKLSKQELDLASNIISYPVCDAGLTNNTNDVRRITSGHEGSPLRMTRTDEDILASLYVGNEDFSLGCLVEDVVERSQHAQADVRVMDGSSSQQRTAQGISALAEGQNASLRDGAGSASVPSKRSVDAAASGNQPKRVKQREGTTCGKGEVGAKAEASASSSQHDRVFAQVALASGSGNIANMSVNSDQRSKALAFLEEMHNSRVPANTKLPCKLCGMLFQRKSDLRRHVKAVHLPEERRFTCEHCDQKFKRKEHLDAHVTQVHEKNCSFKCLLCDKVLISESNRRRHMKQVHPEQDQHGYDEPP